MKHFIIIFSFLSLITVSLNAQQKELLPITKEVIVEEKDSLIRAHVLLERVPVKCDYSTTYYWHYKGTLNSNMGGYTGDLLHGEYRVFDNRKNLLTQGYFENGIKEGIWKKWNSTGLLISVDNFKNGKLHGERIRYNEEGEIIAIDEYKNGELQIEDEKAKKERIPLFSKEGKTAEADSVQTNE